MFLIEGIFNFNVSRMYILIIFILIKFMLWTQSCHTYRIKSNIKLQVSLGVLLRHYAGTWEEWQQICHICMVRELTDLSGNKLY